MKPVILTAMALRLPFRARLEETYEVHGPMTRATPDAVPEAARNARALVTNAHRINRGQLPELKPARDVQVLCPMNRGGLGARSLNIELQQALNPLGELRVERFGWTYCPGDKVMQVANSYDREVFNGDLGVITGIDLEAGELTASFDGRPVTYGFGELDELVLAYATTIHKAQGSEYPAVVIPLTTQHYAMLARNLLYTGVTRGKRLVVLVGQRQALAIAVRNQGARRRWSKLREWLAPGSASSHASNALTG
ncbi:UvrD-like helicase C-terminal domain-containing protein [Belnapia rosea]|nr:UvrD-like helicase C-terminal domain-containing protein [Belnapia rosea]